MRYLHHHRSFMQSLYRFRNLPYLDFANNKTISKRQCDARWRPVGAGGDLPLVGALTVLTFENKIMTD